MKYAIKSNRFLRHSRIALVYLKGCDTTLSVYERFVFLRLFMSYGYSRIDKKHSQYIAAKIDIHYLKLKPTLENLCVKGALELSNGTQVRINPNLIRNYLNSDFHKFRRSGVIGAHYPRFDFILRLFELLSVVRVSHKQKKQKQLREINFKQWLVLLHLVMNSDDNGVVFNAGTHELSTFTGLDRHSILRAITKLFKLGILRSKLDGSLNNSYLRSVASVYFLNLSHNIWGESKVFSSFYLLNFPEPSSNVGKLIDYCTDINNWVEEKVVHQISEFKFDSENKDYRSRLSKIESYIYEKCCVSFGYDPEFNSAFDLIGQKASGSSLKSNTYIENLRRVEFYFQYIATQLSVTHLKYLNLSNLNCSGKVHILMDRFFQTVGANSNLIKASEKFKYPVSDLKQALNESRFNVFYLIAESILRSEISHIYDQIDSTRGYGYQLNLAPYANSYVDSDYTIYFLPDKSLESDQFCILEYEQINGYSDLYNRCNQELELNLDDLKEFGLIHESCQSLEKF